MLMLLATPYRTQLPGVAGPEGGDTVTGQLYHSAISTNEVPKQVGCQRTCAHELSLQDRTHLADHDDPDCGQQTPRAVRAARDEALTQSFSRLNGVLPGTYIRLSCANTCEREGSWDVRSLEQWGPAIQ